MSKPTSAKKTKPKDDKIKLKDIEPKNFLWVRRIIKLNKIKLIVFEIVIIFHVYYYLIDSLNLDYDVLLVKVVLDLVKF